MKVHLKLFASLSSYQPDRDGEGSSAIEIRERTTIRELLEDLKVPLDSVKLIFLNGVHAELEVTLKEGDRLGVFPPVAGG